MADTPRLPFYQDPQFYRVQTYALLGAALLLLLTLFLPLAHFDFTVEGAAGRLTVHLSRLEAVGPVPAALPQALAAQGWMLQLAQVLSAFCLGAALAAVWRYRRLEAVWATSSVLLVVLALLLVGRHVMLYRLGQTLEAELGAAPARTNGWAFYLPLAALVLVYAARDAVRRDRKRLRAAERFY